MSELIGRVCTKIAGREGLRKAVIVDVLEGNFVMIDGQVKRRKCNLSHLELSNKLLKIKKGAPTEDVKKALEKEGIKVTYVKKEKGNKDKPKKQPKESSKKIEKKKDEKSRKSKSKVSGIPDAKSETSKS